MGRTKAKKRGKGRVYAILDGTAERHAAANSAGIPKTGEMTSEVASYSNDFAALPLTNGVVPNPDDVMMTLAPGKLNQYQKLSTDPYLLHRQMRKTDLKYKHLVQTRKNGVLSKEWSLIPNPHDPDQDRAVDVADFLKAALDEIVNFHADLEELLDAIFLGYSIAELMWEQKTVRYGEQKSRIAWVVSDLRGRRQGRFGFAEDNSLMYQESAGKFVPVAPAKFIVHTHAKENEGPHGTAECSEVFWAWFMKHYFVKWWSIFGEKFGMPTAVATHPQNWDDEKKRKLKAMIKAFQTEYGIVVPQGAKIEFLEAQRYGTVNVYQAFLDWADRCMSEAITGQSLATGQGEGGSGSFAQSKTHQEVKQEFVAADAKELMATIQYQLVKPLVVVNFGEEVPLPQFVINYEARNLTAELEMDLKLINEAGIDLPKDYFYETYSRPRPGEGDEVARGRKVAAPAPGLPGQLPESTPLEEDASKPKKPQPKPAAEDDSGTEDDQEPKKPAKKLSRSGNRVFFDATSKAEADLRKAEFDVVLDKLAAEGRAVFGALGNLILHEARMASDLADLRQRIQQIAASGQMQTDLAAALLKAKLNGYLVASAQANRHALEVLEEEAAEEAAKYKGNGFMNWLSGRKRAPRFNREAFNRLMTKTGKMNFNLDFLNDYEPLDPQEALDWFENLVPLTKAELEDLPREAAAGSFTVADIETKDALEKVQDLISDFLSSGRTQKDFVEEYQATRKELGLDATENHKAEQLFRTETGRAYGAGRNRTLRDEEIKGAFPLWQYVAIMDDRTRDEHRALNGFVAEPDDPVWLSKTPPWDHNCRCDIIPLTKRQIETRGIEVKGTVTMPDGSEVDPRTWPTSPAFRGLGF